MRKVNNLEIWRYFIEAVDAGGVNAAAEQLGIEPSTVSRALRSLEQEIGSALWVRNTRPAQLSALGEQTYVRVKDLLAEHDSLESFLFEDKNSMAGVIRISSQIGFTAKIMMDDVCEFLRMYPDIHFEVVDQFKSIESTLYGKGTDRCDIAFGYSTANDINGLVKIYTSTVPYIACASKSYIEENGAPRTPADCLRHRGVLVSSAVRQSTLSLTKDKISLPLRWKSTVVVGNPFAARRAIKLGVGVMPDMSLYHAAQFLQDGSWEVVMPGWQRPPNDAYVYATEESYAKKRVRTFMDWFAERRRAHDAKMKAAFSEYYLM